MLALTVSRGRDRKEGRYLGLRVLLLLLRVHFAHHSHLQHKAHRKAAEVAAPSKAAVAAPSKAAAVAAAVAQKAAAVAAAAPKKRVWSTAQKAVQAKVLREMDTQKKQENSEAQVPP